MKTTRLLLSVWLLCTGLIIVSAQGSADYQVVPLPDKICMQKGKPFVLEIPRPSSSLQAMSHLPLKHVSCRNMLRTILASASSTVPAINRMSLHSDSTKTFLLLRAIV